MARTPFRILRGIELIAALEAMSCVKSSTLFVKWFASKQNHSIPPNQALFIVKAASYEGKFRNGRVYFIRELDDRRSNKLVPEYKDGRAVLQPSPITRKSVDIWDQYFATHPSAIFSTP